MNIQQAYPDFKLWWAELLRIAQERAIPVNATAPDDYRLAWELGEAPLETLLQDNHDDDGDVS